MKIISKFSDYYDSGIAYGVDENLRFKRESVEIDETLPILDPCIAEHNKLRAVLHFKVLGFCGELYPLVHIMIEKVRYKDKEVVYTLLEVDCFYTFSSLEGFMEKHFIVPSKVGRFDGFGYHVGFSLRFEQRIKDFFDKEYRKALPFFIQYQMPYFLLEEFAKKKKNGYYEPVYKNTLLPVLKEIKFVKVKTPIEAFQEISMYLGTLSSKEDDTIVIDDKHLSLAKGFDCYSFKKLPEDKKKKKC